MLEALQMPFFQRVLVAGLLASVAAGVMGTYVVVKRMSSISGGLAHAAFGGVGLGYLAGFHPMLGATIFALASSIGIGVTSRYMRQSLDTLISVMWSVGMALGILFVGLAPGYAPDLTSYLFGSLLFVPWHYVALVGALDVVILVAVTLLFPSFQAVAFDEEFATVAGAPVDRVFLTLLGLTGLAVVTLIRVVGIILAMALLTMPAATARLWSRNLFQMMVVSTGLAAAYTVTGLLASYWLAESMDVSAPPGPLIILLAAVVYGVAGVVRSYRMRAVSGQSQS